VKRSGRVVELGAADPVTFGTDPATSAAGQEVWVEIDDLSACRQCARGQGCGSIVHHQPSSSLRLRCYSSIHVAQSQQVTVVIDEADASWLWLVFGAYGLPLAGLIVGASLGEFFSASSAIINDWQVAVGGFTGLVGGLIAWRYISGPVANSISKGLCLDTARIVAVSAQSLETER
jgi:positive regulator of sigma E activity